MFQDNLNYPIFENVFANQSYAALREIYLLFIVLRKERIKSNDFFVGSYKHFKVMEQLFDFMAVVLVVVEEES